MPKVVAKIREKFPNIKVVMKENVDETVALGAATHAAMILVSRCHVQKYVVIHKMILRRTLKIYIFILKSKLKNQSPWAKQMVLKDITNISVGIAVNNVQMLTYIRKNSKLPIKETIDVFINKDKKDQTCQQIDVYEGEDERVERNTLIASITLTGLELPIPGLSTLINVVFHIGVVRKAQNINVN